MPDLEQDILEQDLEQDLAQQQILAQQQDLDQEQAQIQSQAIAQALTQKQKQGTPQGILQGTSSTKFDPYGNYINFARLRPRDRRELNRALKQGMTAKYINENGEITDLSGPMSRSMMRQIGRDQRTILAGAERGLGFKPKYETDQNGQQVMTKESQYANDVLRGFVQHSNSPYITYTKKQEAPASKPAGTADASSTGATGTHTYTSTTITPEKKYTANFTYNGLEKEAALSNESFANQFLGFMGDNYSNWKVENQPYNYFDDITKDDTNITYDELTKWLMKTFNVTNLTPETWKQILENAVTNGIVAEGVQFKKTGGMIKFQNGGSAESEQQQIIKQIIEKVKQARAGVAEARQWIASVKEQSRRSPRYKQISDMIDQISARLDEQEQGAAYAANGAKLAYIQRLRNKCPEGFELEMFKAGGQICTKCVKKAEYNDGEESDIVKSFKEKCGGKMKKKCTKKCEFGGTADYDAIELLKEKCGGKVKKKCATKAECGGKAGCNSGEESDIIKSFKEKCGGKMKKKKCECGGQMKEEKCGGKMEEDKCGGKMKKKKCN